ncbi:MAG: Crp/Fnr family transcriptional regulator [Oscillospiraceae bacterium]|nr:Crp/Fnr family transcriptional regulator [Oscillospiraceae bacterium]
MEKYYPLLEKTPLFKGISPQNLESMLKCLSAKTKSYEKGEAIMLAGEDVKNVGIVLDGKIQIQKEDINGERIILDELDAGEIFGEVFACAGIKKSPVTVCSILPSEILFVDYRRIITMCPSNCSFHSSLIRNMLMLIAQKNIMLNSKLDIISKKTTREKLFAYFKTQAKKTGGKIFELPFSRDELADYLCVNRSAMSRELCKLRDENFIEFEKRTIKILKWPVSF